MSKTNCIGKKTWVQQRHYLRFTSISPYLHIGWKDYFRPQPGGLSESTELNSLAKVSHIFCRDLCWSHRLIFQKLPTSICGHARDMVKTLFLISVFFRSWDESWHPLPCAWAPNYRDLPPLSGLHYLKVRKMPGLKHKMFLQVCMQRPQFWVIPDDASEYTQPLVDTRVSCQSHARPKLVNPNHASFLRGYVALDTRPPGDIQLPINWVYLFWQTFPLKKK